MAIKKRVVKRIVRKVIFLVLIVAFISLVTTMIVEKRLKGGNKPTEEEADESNLDPNGDPITPEFRDVHVPPLRRQARPPYQDRNSVREAPKAAPEILTQPATNQFRLPMPQGERKDWHDYAAMAADKQRSGLGEHGLPAKIEDPAEQEAEQLEYRRNGFNGMLSDRISVNRSLPDVRHEE